MRGRYRVWIPRSRRMRNSKVSSLQTGESPRVLSRYPTSGLYPSRVWISWSTSSLTWCSSRGRDWTSLIHTDSFYRTPRWTAASISIAVPRNSSWILETNSRSTLLTGHSNQMKLITNQSTTHLLCMAHHSKLISIWILNSLQWKMLLLSRRSRQ